MLIPVDGSSPLFYSGVMIFKYFFHYENALRINISKNAAF